MNGPPSIATMLARGRQPLLSCTTMRYSSQTVLLVVAFALLNASNYVFHIVASRILGPGDYGALAALLALLMILSVPLSVVQTAVAKRTAETSRREVDATGAALATVRSILPAAAAASLAVIAAAPVLAAFLHTTTVETVLLAPYVLLALLASVPLGALQGAERFGRLVAAPFAGAVVRLACGIVLLELGLGVAGALAALTVSQAVTLVLALHLLGVRPSDRHRWSSTAAARLDLGRTFLALTGFWTFAELDVVLARHFLAPESAGQYSSAGLVARGLLFIVAAVAVASLPRFASSGGRGEAAVGWLRVSLRLVAGLSVAGVAGLVILREVLVAAAFGPAYARAASLLPLLAVAVAVLAFLLVLVYFHIAASTRAYLILFAGAGAEVLLVWRFHKSPEQIALVFLCVALLVAGAQFHAAFAAARYDPAPLDRARALSPMLELSVVLPCHNAAHGLPQVLERVRSSVADVGSHEVIVVSDGSTDESAAVARAVTNVRVLEYDHRVGKGHALRIGLAEARGRYVAFIDADGDVEPESLRPFVELMRLYEPDIVLGSKRHPLSEVEYPPLRRLLSWGYHKLGRVLFRVDVRDTQTGLKLVRREVLTAALPRMLEKRYAFDLELLVVARRLGFRRVFEAPVRLNFRFGSSIDVRATARIFIDTLAIAYRRYVLDTYRVDAGQGAHRRRLERRRARRRIVIVNWKDVRHPDAGGAETYVHEAAKRWVARGHVVELLAAGFPGAPRVETIDGVRVRRLGRLRNGTFHALVQRELVRARAADVLVESINTVPFLGVVHRRTVPVLAIVYQLAGEVWDAEFPPAIAAVGRAVEPRLLALYRRVPTVTISASTECDLAALGFRDVTVVAPGLDEAPPGRVPKEATPTFAFVGRLETNKRPDHAIAALAHIRRRLPEAQLWVIGRGTLEQRLRVEAPEGVELLGHVGREELYDRLRRAHCLLVPSVREGWGLVVVEAGSVGTPSAGYDVPGLRDSIIDGRTGVLAAAGDPAALADAAIGVVCGDRYDATATAARTWAACHSWERTADELFDVIDSRIRTAEKRSRDAALGTFPVATGVATGT